MKKNKFLYMISAFALACIISFSGVGGSYIQAKASSGITDVLWNDNATAWENISRHALLWANWAGAFIEPSLVGEMFAVGNSAEFAAYMVTEGYTEEEAEECVHGGGGHVRDGISLDDNGNVTYSDEVSDLFHGFILDYLDSNSGYSIVKTFKAKDIGLKVFQDESKYNNFVGTIENLGVAFFDFYYVSAELGYIPTDNLFCTIHPSEMFDHIDGNNDYLGHWYYGTYKDSVYPVQFTVLEDDWTNHSPYVLKTIDDSVSELTFSDKIYSLSDFNISTDKIVNNYLRYYTFSDYPVYRFICSNDGRNLKLWYDLDAFKNYDVGNQMYYVTDSFNNYNSAIDNSTTITSQEFAYYNDNSTTLYQTIQNNINNYGGELDEKTVQDIVDSAVQEIKDSIANSGNQGGNDSEDSESGGNGIGNLVDGIGKLLDTVLSLIGKVMGVVADFTQSILDLFSGFTDFTDGFSNFLSGAFSFIPQEIWNVIQVGLSLMILLAVIKFLRK